MRPDVRPPGQKLFERTLASGALKKDESGAVAFLTQEAARVSLLAARRCAASTDSVVAVVVRRSRRRRNVRA
jgi:hypothetical protein